MKFKKTALQGNFIFSNGTLATFSNGIYETEDEGEIAQLKTIYAEASESDLVTKETPKTAPTLTGKVSSASLAALAK